MRIIFLLFTVLFLSVFQLQSVQTQDKEITNTFKIVGKTKAPTFQNSLEMRTVEYDQDQPDHLFISYFSKDGKIETRIQFLFKGRKFNLANLAQYLDTKELLIDGLQTNYREDGSIESEQIVAKDKNQQKTTYFPNGNKQTVISGDESILNGVYEIWYPNGQLNFSGKYNNDLKDGEFQQFDSSGTLIRKGVYQDGKLVSGEAVVQEKNYEKPEIYAQYINGDNAFDEYLKLKSENIKGLNDIPEEKIFILNFRIDKTGKVTKITILSVLKPNEQEIIHSVFNDIPDFTPATVENIPVESELKLQFVLSKERIKQFSEKPSDVYMSVNQMPIFPGGLTGIRNFLSMNIKYPSEALERRITGKVYVNFVIDEEGKVGNIKILKGVHFSLDEEAIRVVGLMPKWEPGRMDGKPVKVAYTVPISFNMVFNDPNRLYWEIKDKMKEKLIILL